MLYIVSTPIGNLKDITLRAIEVLNQVDVVICEDTRRSGILLNHYNVLKPQIALNDFNEQKLLPQIITRLKAGENLALISDAGTPLVSDPGFKLVRECIRQDISIDAVPGPSSVITSLVLSGYPPDKFYFWGFLPDKKLQRESSLRSMKDIFNINPITFIIFVSPYKLLKTLEDILAVLGDIKIVLAKELTKIYQKVEEKKVSQLMDEYKGKKIKGEYILLLRLDE